MIKMYLKRLCFTVTFFLLHTILWAQDSDSIPATLDSTIRSQEKIYVVMAVCLLILATLFLYLVRIDRKVSKKEKA